MKEQEHQCFRIALDHRQRMVGHVLSAWANPNNDFIETGLLLQHIEKDNEKKILKDLLLDHQPLNIEPEEWQTAILEVSGNEALFRLNDHVAYANALEIGTEKQKSL